MITQAVAQHTREQFERTNFLKRTHLAIKAINKEKGAVKSGFAIALLSGSALVGGGLCWLTLEGAVRSFIDLTEDTRHIVGLRALGDAGGWTSLSLFTVLGVKMIFERVIHEGEYIRFKTICREWLENKEQNFKEQAYPYVFDFINMLSSRCLFDKSHASKRVIAIELCNPALDSRLLDTFKDISAKMGAKTHCKSCCRTFSNKGCSVNLSAKIFGIAFPILFMINFALSITGEVGLGKELFVLGQDLTAVGHFGEWPINAIEAAATAYLLYRWYIGSDTASKNTRELYSEHLEELEPELKPRLRQIAQDELRQLGESSAYLQLPTDYDMDELADQMQNL